MNLQTACVNRYWGSGGDERGLEAVSWPLRVPLYNKNETELHSRKNTEQRILTAPKL